MTVLRRAELLKIFYNVAKNITPEMLEVLKKIAPGAWENFTHLEGPSAKTDWEIRNLRSVVSISFRIQELVDAKISVKSGKIERLRKNSAYADGLPKIYLAWIAYYEHDIDIADKNKYKLANELLQKL